MIFNLEFTIPLTSKILHWGNRCKINWSLIAEGILWSHIHSPVHFFHRNVPEQRSILHWCDEQGCVVSRCTRVHRYWPLKRTKQPHYLRSIFQHAELGDEHLNLLLGVQWSNDVAAEMYFTRKLTTSRTRLDHQSSLMLKNCECTFWCECFMQQSSLYEF